MARADYNRYQFYLYKCQYCDFISMIYEYIIEGYHSFWTNDLSRPRCKYICSSKGNTDSQRNGLNLEQGELVPMPSMGRTVSLPTFS